MINLKKFIRLVKDGQCFYNSFNIKTKKTADNIIDEEDEMGERWLAEQQLKLKQRGVGEKTPSVPSGVSVPPPHQDFLDIPNDVDDAMDAWIRGIKEELMPVGQITTTLPTDLESYVSPNPDLYRVLNLNPSWQEVLAKKINQQIPAMDREKANLFVKTMLVKTEGLMSEFDIRNQDAIAEDAEKRLKEEQKRRNKMIDPYALAKEFPDPGIGVKAYERFINLSPEEKENLYSVIHLKFTKEMLANGIKYRLTPPEKSSKIDQRMNFFLRFPQYVKPVMDPTFEGILKQEFSNMGIKTTDVFQGLFQAYQAQTKGAKRRTCNILNNLKGPELYNILLNLIEKADPNLMEWIKGAMVAGDKEKEQEYMGFSAGEGETPEENLSGKTERDLAQSVVTDFDVKHSSGIISNIMNTYLSPIVTQARKIGIDSIEDMASDVIKQYKETKNSDRRKAALKLYEIAEKINAFVDPLLDHLNKLLQVKGKASSSDSETMFYQVEEGEMYVPVKVLKDVYRKLYDKDGEEIEEPEINPDDHKSLVERYKNRIEAGHVAPFAPNWTGMVNYRYPSTAYNSMGILKEQIKKIAKRNVSEVERGNTDFIRVHLMGSEKLAPLLSRFAGVRETDRQERQIQKINDFIYMTLNQDDDYIERLKKLGPKRQVGGAFSGKNKEYHNLLAEIGVKYPPLLGYLINRKEFPEILMEKKRKNRDYEFTPEEIQKGNESDNYTPQSLEILISILDHYPAVKRFMRAGRQINIADRKHRTNTEIYYNLKGEKLPASIKELLNIYREGVNKSETHHKKNIVLPENSWYREFFMKYDKLSILLNEQKDKKDTMKRIQDSMNKRYFELRGQTISTLRNIMSQEGALDQILISIPNKKERVETKQRIIQWWEDGGLTVNLLAQDYKILGIPKTKGLMKQELTMKGLKEGHDSKTGEFVPGLDAINKDVQEQKIELNNMLISNGYTPQDPTALKLAREAYKRVLYKIAVLEKIKKTNIKLASTNYIDMAIARAKTEFDHYFESLFL
jgi:hypothetical protein